MNNIHCTAVISDLSDIERSSRGSKLTIGANSVIDSFVKIKFAGGIANIEIGSACYINSGCVLYSGNGIQIGNNVLIAANCTLAPTNHAYHDVSKKICDQGFMPSKGGIIIEDDVWIGANSVILDGAYIPIGCIIGAGSLVKSRLEAYTVYAGNPLRRIRER